MPDAHWLTEARLKGTKIVVIACEYSATATKADEAIVVRPGTTPALALGLANVIIREKLYDAITSAVDRSADARPDGHAEDAARGRGVRRRARGALERDARARRGRAGAGARRAARHVRARGASRRVGRLRLVGRADERAEADDARPGGSRSTVEAPMLEGAVEVTLADGSRVRCRPVFDLTQRVRRALRSEDDRRAHLGAGRGHRVAGAARSPRSPARRSSASAWGPTSSSTTTTRTAPASARGADRQRRQDRRQRRLVRRQLPRVALQRLPAVHQREPVRPRARPARSRPGRGSTGSRSRRTTTTTRTIR